MLNMKTYTKKNFKYWTAKKLNKHSLTIYKSIIILMALFTLWAYINREVNKGGLVDPRVSHVVHQVMASEGLRKESTRSWKMYQYIRFVESNNGTKGLAVTCKNKGKINEVGFRALSGYCFNNERDQETTVMQYIESRLNSGWTESEILCFYNSGKKLSTCPYSLGDLSNAN